MPAAGPEAPALPSVTVVVPSYRRPDQLVSCLQGLAAQRHPADEVVVVCRPDDAQTRRVVAAAPLPVREVLVHEPGVLAALHTGARAARGDVVAFTDDDAVAHPDWLQRLMAHYADPAVGGVGGRDLLQPPLPDAERPSTSVGRFTPWGKQLGFHHVGSGPAADVSVLKGVNMSYRREALALPRDLKGEGAQVHNEVGAGLWARDRGWRLVYEPAARVDHFSGPRFDEDQRSRPSPGAIEREAYNLVLSLLTFRPELTARRAAYGLLLGDQASPGVGRALVAAAQRRPEVVRRLVPSLRGQVSALRDLRRGARVEVEPVVPDAPRGPAAAPRLRVLHLLNDLDDRGNGINNSTVDLACEQVAQGLEVHVASRTGGYAGLLADHGVQWHPLDQTRTPGSLARLVPAYLRLLRRLRPDVVHVHNLTGAALATTVPGPPTVATLHLEEKAGVRLMARADAVVVFSPQAAGRMTALGAAPSRVHLVRQGVLHGARSRALVPSAPPALPHPTVVTVAGLYRHKGVYDLLAALPRIRAEVPGAHLVYVGAGPEDQGLLAAVEAAGLTGAVTMAGFQRDPRAFMQAADVFVLASRSEPAGLVLMEARDTGVPVVATDVDGIPTLVEHGRSALLVPPADPVALAAAVVRVLREPGLTEALVRGGREGLDALTTERFTRDVTEVYVRVRAAARR